MTTPIREIMRQEIAEGGSALLTATLLDEAGAAVPLASLGTLTLTLYDESSDAIINLRDGTNIKNANGGTVHATDGSFSLLLGPDDNPITDPTKRAERHIALIIGTYNGGANVVTKEISITVRNLNRVA